MKCLTALCVTASHTTKACLGWCACFAVFDPIAISQIWCGTGGTAVGREDGGEIASGGSPRGGKHLNAQTQRILRGAPATVTESFCNTCIFRGTSSACLLMQLHSPVLTMFTACHTETAARDRIGRGHNPEIAPLSGILAKLKEQRKAVIARCTLSLSCSNAGRWLESGSNTLPIPTMTLVRASH